jgi:hypothetical protein
MYWFFYRPVSQSAYMQTSSANLFLNPGSGLVHRLFAGLGTALGANTLRSPRLLLAFLFAAGLWAILRTKSLSTLVIAVAPFLRVFSAAAFRLYPLRERLLLFTLPLLFLIYASGITAVCNFRLPRVWRIAAVSCLFFAIVTPVLSYMPRWFEFVLYNFAPARQVMEHMNSIDSQSPVYVMGGDVRAWLFYAGNWMQPQILKQNIDAAYRLRFYGQDLGVREDRASNGGRLEIDGEFEPDSSVEARWAAAEASRIAAEAEKSVWIFVPRYLRVANRTGELRANRLLMLLDGELELHGGRCVNDQSRGETIARLYVFGDYREASNTSCPAVSPSRDVWP